MQDNTLVTTLYIKNMVCARCIKTVAEIFSQAGLTIKSITLGEVWVEGIIDPEKISQELLSNGFELLQNQAARLVDRVKTTVIQLIYSDSLETMAERFSHRIAREIGKDYEYLSTLFSSVEAMTIERFIIVQKIERVKELLTYDELTLSEIAYRLGYSSPAHVSRQFKEVVGMTPTAFKALRYKSRTSIDLVGKF